MAATIAPLPSASIPPANLLAVDGVREEAAAAMRESLLVLSDVHLGSDLNDLAPSVRRSEAVDRDLTRLIRHYQSQKPPHGDRWRLVFAGDFVDFIGITIRETSAASDALQTEPIAEEREHGLGNAADHARTKLQRVVVRHSDVFDALADFVAAGNALTLVHGNHDVEFHWDKVQEEFRGALLRHARRDGAPSCAAGAIDAEAFDQRITFHPWFYLLDGVAYIEHGHQYDTYCAYDNVIMPLSPLDPRRVVRGFSDVLLRYVVRPTRGLREYGHESMGVVDYVSFAMKLGVVGMISLGVRFARAIIELFRLRRQHFAQAATQLRAEHERRVALLAEATRIGKDRIRALLAMQAPPVTRSIRGIMASLLLDRLALGFLSVLVLLGAGAFGAMHGHGWYFVGSVLVGWALMHRQLARARNLDPSETLADRAEAVARLFPVAFVVMGHTHVPVQREVAPMSTYINVGSWAEEEADAEHPAPRAARTHLVIHGGDAGPVARFLAWDEARGPLSFSPSLRG